jgi:HAE1 family hydrophobic/amphiphilic exporter-1
MGMLPLAVMGGAGAELYRGLGAVIVGGLAFSTLFSLLFVPILISLGQDAREAWDARRRTGAPAELSTVRA